jgi:hypothetical protein
LAAQVKSISRSGALALNLVAAAALLSTFSAPLAVAKSEGAVVCGCLTAEPSDRGSFSCVAFEKQGICRIHTDPFEPMAEKASAEFMSQAWRRDIEYVHISKDEPDEWQVIEDRNLIKQLAVYFGISLKKNKTEDISTENIRNVMNKLYSYSPQISAAFLSTVGSGLKSPNVYATYGCVEYRGPEFSIMYKAPWSNARTTPRCQ